MGRRVYIRMRLTLALIAQNIQYTRKASFSFYAVYVRQPMYMTNKPTTYS